LTQYQRVTDRETDTPLIANMHSTYATKTYVGMVAFCSIYTTTTSSTET